ncbi:MAG: ATP-binding cassette domain-containing protein [Pseudomonadota bacterium]
MLEIDGLARAFGALRAVDGVSLALAPGQCHALIGPNGAGKTTLMQMISGLVRPDAGRVVFEGRDVTLLAPAARARLGLGRSFQVAAVIGALTAGENAALAAQAAEAARGARPRLSLWRRAGASATLRAAAASALAEVGLQDRAGVPAADLAHGERRLLELAMVLATAPRALVLDEPMAGLGAGESRTLTALLGRLKARLPLMMVEHDMDAVFALADRVSLMVEGRLVAAGTPAEVRADPAARAAYLGDAA